MREEAADGRTPSAGDLLPKKPIIIREAMVEILERHKAVHRFGNRPDNGTVEHCVMSSDILGTRKSFSVYLPAGYDDGTERYPAVYLLHPGGGTDDIWIRSGQLPEIADDAIRSGMALPMIIVMADGSGEDADHLGRHLGFFSVDGWDYEAYFHKELIPLIDSYFRTVADKAHRAIAGASMGGEAAIAYAQKYTDFYGVACALSGILGHPEESQLAGSDKAYGDSLTAHDPSEFVQQADAATVERLKSVRWYADCGDSDLFYDGNVEFFLAMKRKGIAMDYRMRSGVHGWYYWITGMAPLLRFASIAFAK